MAQLDPSIILGYKPPQFPTMQTVQEQKALQYRNALSALQLQQGQQEMQRRNALLDAFRQPGAMDSSTGMPTANTLSRIMQVDPQAGITLQKNMLSAQAERDKMVTEQIHGRLYGLQASEKQAQMLGDQAVRNQTRYDGLIASGVPKDQAAKIVTQESGQWVADREQAGLFTPDQAQRLKNPFNPVANQAFIRAVPSYQSMEKVELEKNKPQSNIAKLNSDLQAGRITQSQHDQGVLAAAGGSSPQSIDDTAALIASYKMAPLSSFAMSRPIGARIMARVKEINPEYDAKLWHGGLSATTNFFGGKKGDTVRSFNVAINHLDTLSNLSDALQNGNVQAINKIANRASQEMGGSAPTSFNAAKQLVADEIVKAIVGSGGGVQDREEAAKAVNAAQSPDQLKGVINTYQKLLAGQIEGFQRQYKATTGRSDFSKRFLSPNVVKMVDDVSEEHNPTKPAAKASAASALPTDIPPGSKLIGRLKSNGKAVFQSPDGKKWISQVN